MKTRIEIDIPGTLNRFAPKYKKAQQWLDNDVLRCNKPYVPMREGDLYRSGTLGTVAGEGKVVYNSPYAKRMYYGFGFHFNKEKNALACAQWFEKAKAVNLKDWENGVNRIMKSK